VEEDSQASNGVDANGDATNEEGNDDAEVRGDCASRIVAEWKYNVAVPGPDSIDIIRRLESARLLLHVSTLINEYNRMRVRETEICDLLSPQYKVDVTLSNTKPRGRRGRSPRQWGMKHLRHRDVPDVEKLVDEYDALHGQLNHLCTIHERLQELVAAGRVDAEGHIAVRSGFYKLVNRRYQSAHFWPSEISGKDVIAEWEPAPERPPN